MTVATSVTAPPTWNTCRALNAWLPNPDRTWTVARAAGEFFGGACRSCHGQSSASVAAPGGPPVRRAPRTPPPARHAPAPARVAPPPPPGRGGARPAPAGLARPERRGGLLGLVLGLGLLPLGPLRFEVVLSRPGDPARA